MRKHLIPLAIMVAAAALPPAHAGVFKCHQGGAIVYSDKPCPDAKPIDTTNAAAPPLPDAYSAKARALRDQAKIIQADIDKRKDERRREICQQMARDHNWLQTRAAKYRDDPWWVNKVSDSFDRLEKACANYMLPQGAR